MTLPVFISVTYTDIPAEHIHACDNKPSTITTITQTIDEFTFLIFPTPIKPHELHCATAPYLKKISHGYKRLHSRCYPIVPYTPTAPCSTTAHVDYMTVITYLVAQLWRKLKLRKPVFLYTIPFYSLHMLPKMKTKICISYKVCFHWPTHLNNHGP